MLGKVTNNIRTTADDVVYIEKEKDKGKNWFDEECEHVTNEKTVYEKCKPRESKFQWRI